MKSEASDPIALDADVRPTAVLIAALRRTAGVDHTPLPDRLHELAEGAADWREGLARAGRAAGFVVREVELSPAAVCENARRDAPLVAFSPRSGWTAVVADGRDRPILCFPTATGEPLTAPALAERLALPDAGTPTGWLLLRAVAPAPREAQGDGPTAFERVLAFARPDRADIVAIVLYAVLIGLMSLAVPVAVQQLVNSVAFGGLVQPVVVLAFLLFIGLAFAASLSAFQAFLAEMFQRRLFVRTSVDLAERLPRVRAGAFASHYGPERVNRFFDLLTLQKTGSRLLLEGSAVVLQTATGLLILSFYHPLMLGLSVVLVAAMAGVVFGLGRGAPGTALHESSAKYALAEWLEELARHAAAFRGRSGRSHALTRADALATGWVEARRRHYRIVLRQLVAALGLQALVNTLVLALGGFLVVSGELTLGQLVASEIIVSAVVAGFARLGKQLESFYDVLAAAEKVGSLFDLPVEREGGRSRDRARLGGGAAIATTGLGHAWSDGTAIRFPDLRIESGERMALVGPSASGKSTLVDLLGGLRAPTRGYVEIDGDDLRELDLASLREEVFCLREPEIFSGSVLDNLRIAREQAPLDDVERALERVGLLDEIRRLPQGLRTRVSTHGVPLSRSQIARLMFARACLARPRLLIVDGELSELEGEARERVLDALFAPDAPWTLVVASAREDVLERCGRVIRLATDPNDARVDPRPGADAGEGR
ncbi:MAG: ATP-binding cassette domain-containing protein [Myxococcota bacterium]